jgi:hypothetical protein
VTPSCVFSGTATVAMLSVGRSGGAAYTAVTYKTATNGLPCSPEAFGLDPSNIGSIGGCYYAPSLTFPIINQFFSNNVSSFALRFSVRFTADCRFARSTGESRSRLMSASPDPRAGALRGQCGRSVSSSGGS